MDAKRFKELQEHVRILTERAELFKEYESKFKPTKWSKRALGKYLDTLEYRKDKINYLTKMIDSLKRNYPNRDCQKFIEYASEQCEYLKSKKKIQVINKEVFIGIMKALRSYDCVDMSAKQLAQFIDNHFETGLSEGTIYNKVLPDYQKFDVLEPEIDRYGNEKELFYELILKVL